MPVVQKSNKKGRIRRNPLANISNTGHSSTHTKAKNNAAAPGFASAGICHDQCSRLRNVHADLSTTIEKIDQIVAHSNHLDSCKLESLADLLAQTNKNLKDWLLNMEKLLYKSTAPRSQPPPSPPPAFLNDENIFGLNNFANSIPSSPLVSWQPGSTTVGNDLFVLTPCTKPISFSTNAKDASPEMSTLADQNKTCSVAKASFFGVERQDSVASGQVETKRLGPQQCQSSKVNENVAQTALLKPSVIPVLKACTSPMAAQGKSRHECIRIVSDPSTSTPFSKEPKCDVEDFELQVPKSLIKKYSSLFKDEVEGTAEDKPLWSSPPKTCLLMFPSSDSSSDHVPNSQELHKKVSLNCATPQTPTISKPDHDAELSGKKKLKQPGVETLRKELWARFQAASDDVHSNVNPACTGSRKYILSESKKVLVCDVPTTSACTSQFGKPSFPHTDFKYPCNETHSRYTSGAITHTCPKEKLYQAENELGQGIMTREQVQVLAKRVQVLDCLRVHR